MTETNNSAERKRQARAAPSHSHSPDRPRHIELLIGAVHQYANGYVAVDRHGQPIGTYASAAEAIQAIADALRGRR
jgi:hypothetical protein